MKKIEPIAVGSPESQRADPKAENIATLKTLFPELPSERIVDGKMETAINVDVLKQLLGDTMAVFRDSAFESDVAKSNLAAILQQHGIAQVRSL